MAREISFPRTRHVALSEAEQIDEVQAKAHGIEALLWPSASAEEEARRSPPAGTPLPQPVQPGALPPAAPAPDLAPGTQPPAAAPSVRVLPRVVVVDISLHASQADQCAALDGSPAPVRCPSSLEGRQSTGDAAARAAKLGEAV